MMKSNIFKVEGLNCSHCARALESSLSNLEGIKKVTVSLEDASVAIEGENVPDLNELNSVLAEAGDYKLLKN